MPDYECPRTVEILLVEDNAGNVRLTREAIEGALSPNLLSVMGCVKLPKLPKLLKE